jgi:excisionase family DNA binding protein
VRGNASPSVSLSSVRALQFCDRRAVTQKGRSDHHHQLPPEAFACSLSAGNGAIGPDTASLAEGLAEIIERVAAETAAEIARLVNEQHTAKDEQTYYTTREAAAYLRCCVGRVHNLSSQGRLKGRREGGRRLYTRAELDGIVEATP